MNSLKLLYNLSIKELIIPKNTILLKADKPAPGLYIVKEGIVKYFLQKERTRYTVRYDGAQSIHGINALFDLPNTMSLAAITKIKVHFIPLDVLNATIAKNARFDISTINHLHHKIKLLTDRLKTMCCMDVTQRVALSILELCKLNGVDHTGSIARKEIADFAGCSIEYAFRTLASFQKQGIIILDNRNIVIKNKKSLLKILEHAKS